MARKYKITRKRRLLFLAELLDTGAVTMAAKASGIGRSSWYDLKERDPEFSILWDDADAEFMDVAERVAFKRGINGSVKTLPYVDYNGDDKKTKFYKIVTKSDRLLELCLKSRHPLYKPTKALELTSPDGSMTPTPGDLPEWDNLTPDEIEQLTILQRKLHAVRDGRG